MKRIFLFISFICFFSAIDLFSQEMENVVIHRDKSFYVAGETIWYKAYFPEKPVKSRILHVEIIHPEGKSVYHQKLKIEDNQAFGEIDIPADWASGLYTLRVYTLWNLNFPDQFIFQQELPIYAKDENSPHSYSKLNQEKSVQSEKVNIDLHINPPVPSRREVVKINLKVTDNSGKPVKANMSVSVVDQRFTGSLSSVSQQVEEMEKLPSSAKSTGTFSYQKKLMVEGTAWEENSEKLLESNYFIIWSVEDIKPTWTEVKQGKFLVELDDFTGNKTLQIHDFSPFRSRNPKVKLWSTESIPPIKPLAVNELSEAKTAGEYLNLTQKRDLLKVVFQLESPIDPPPIQDSLTSPFSPDKAYFLDKYIPFSSLESFIGEGMPWVSVRMVNGQKTIMMENYDTKDVFELPPLFLIDHYLSFNNQEMLKLPWKSLRYIEQFMRTKTLEDQFGLLGRFGVLSMYTRSGVPNPKFYEKENTFIFQGFHEPAKFPAPDFMENMYSKDKVPDFRSTIFWNPEVNTDENGQAEVRFIHLDTRGEFEVRIEGRTEKGEIFSQTAKYRVN